MAAGKINLQKASGGITAITGVDGTGNTQLVLPESGTVSSVDTSVTDNAIARYNGATGKLQNSSVTIDDNGNIGSGTQSFNGFGGCGFKNYIINGDMRIAQRGSGPFTTNGYGIDQWFSFISGTSSVIRNWEGTGSNHLSYAQVTVGSGADTVTMEHRLESPHRFSGKTLTLSYKLFNGNYFGSEVSYNIALNHAGGRTILFLGTSVFTGGDKKKVTFTVPDLSGYTLNTSSFLEIRPVEIIGKGYSGTFGITDIQLEEGSVATPFEHKPIGLELSLCQRYYEVLGCGIGQVKDASSIVLHFSSSEKRVPATAILLNTSPYAESPINLTARNGVSSTIATQMNQSTSKSSGHIILITGFSSMTAGQSASINAGVIALSAEL